MLSKSLTKLLTSPITKLTWAQIQRLKQLGLKPNNKSVHHSSKNSDTLPLRSSTVTNLSPDQKHLPKEVCANSFGTSTSHSFWNKLTTYDRQQVQVPAELYAHKAEVEPLLVEGVGWAGQPLVRRIHPIVPEVYGDLSDIFTAVEKLPGASSRTLEEGLPSSQTNGANKIVSDSSQLRGVDKDGSEGYQVVKDNVVGMNKAKEAGEVKSPSRSSDAITFMEEDIKSGGAEKRPHSKEVHYIPLKHEAVKGKDETKRKSRGQVVTGVGVISKKDKHLKKLKKVHLNSGFLLTRQKKKSKKKTKVCSSKANVPLITKAKIKKSKKKNVSMFDVSKKRSQQPNVFFNHRASVQPVRKSVVILANRQIQTYSQANQAKVAVKVKERTSTTVLALGKKLKKSSRIESEGRYPEDCKCPETLETKSRFSTKICGEAAGAQDKKKKKEWKGKMCPVEHRVNHRRRTFVCTSAKFGKAKRKRQLPKCVKPEKKVAPRVIVCPPVLEDELKKREKKCVKQVEEVKIRSRTKVCKPIIIYQKEEAAVVVQKKVCVEKKVKKTISRHTKVCPPSEQTDGQKKSKR